MTVKWEAFYEPWDAIADRRTVTALCLVFDRVHVWTLQHGGHYPRERKAIEQFEEHHYKTRLGNSRALRQLETWHGELCEVFGASGVRWTFDQTLELDRRQLLSYALEWYPFFNFVTPLAEGDDPVLVGVDTGKEPHGELLTYRNFVSGTVRPRSVDEMAKLLRANRVLGIQREMRAAASAEGGVCVSDVPYRPLTAIDDAPYWDLFGPLLAYRLTSERLPVAVALEAEEILEARDSLRGELSSFRETMREMALDMAACLDEDGTVRPHQLGLLMDAHSQRVRLRIEDLRSRLKGERRRLYRKLLEGMGGPLGLSSLIVSFVSAQWWVSAVGLALQSGLVYRDHRKLLSEMRRETGLAFLVDMEHRFKI